MLAGQQKLSLVVFGVGVASVGVAVWYKHACTGYMYRYAGNLWYNFMPVALSKYQYLEESVLP